MAMGHSALVMPEDGAADTPWTRDSNAQTADCDGKQSHSQIQKQKTNGPEQNEADGRKSYTLLEL